MWFHAPHVVCGVVVDNERRVPGRSGREGKGREGDGKRGDTCLVGVFLVWGAAWLGRGEGERGGLAWRGVEWESHRRQVGVKPSTAQHSAAQHRKSNHPPRAGQGNPVSAKLRRSCLASFHHIRPPPTRTGSPSSVASFGFTPHGHVLKQSQLHCQDRQQSLTLQ